MPKLQSFFSNYNVMLSLTTTCHEKKNQDRNENNSPHCTQEKSLQCKSSEYLLRK